MENKTVKMGLLLDAYGRLLTDKQRQHLDLYYNEDFSLAEIAGLCGVTRQGVRDSITRGERTLLDWEEKTGLLDRLEQIARTAEEIGETLNALRTLTEDEALSPLFTKIETDLARISDARF